MKHNLSWNVYWMALVLVAACGHPPDHPGQGDEKEPAAKQHGEHEDEPEHEAVGKRVVLPADVVQAMGIRTAPARMGRLREVIQLPGEVVADPDRMARLTSPIAGRIVQVDLHEGATVTVNEPLAVLTIPELGRIGAAQAGAAAKAKALRANANRLQELAGQGLAPKQEALAARADAEALEAEAAALAKQLRALGAGSPGETQARLVLRAPLAGTVVQRDAVLGTPVDTQHVLATIADLSEVWFLGRLFERDLDRIRVGAAVEVVLHAHPKAPFAGTVEAVASLVDPASRTVTARIRLHNRDNLLRLGLFGSAAVATGEQEGPESLLVPRAAVTEINGKPAVFVRQADGDFELHPVTLGQAALGDIAVLSGLRAGEVVVVDGVFNLKSVLLRGSLAEED